MIIEEKGNNNALIDFLVWIAILIIIGSGIYYIFFKKPELIQFTASSSFKDVQQLSKINISSDQLINSPQFQALKQHITAVEPKDIGRTNPFLGF